MNYWELIFAQSKVNGSPYYEDRLPQQNWDWPQGTWFQQRLSYVRTIMSQPEHVHTKSGFDSQTSM